MKTINQTFSTKIEIKKSKFIGYFVPFDQFQILYKQLKKEHPKANHIVYAYRYIDKNNQIVSKKDDDKEPKNSSAAPILNILEKEEIINSTVIVVRYFGGIKLGIGGLVKSYSLCAKELIEKANLIPFNKKEIIEFTISYSKLSKIKYLIKQYNAKIKKEEFFDKVYLTIEIEKEILNKFKKEIEDKL